MSAIEILNPDVLDRPFGQYSHVTRVKAASELLFISGQLGNERGGRVPPAFEAQVEQTFLNIQAVLESEGLGWRQVIQFTTYVTDARFIPRLHDWRRANFPRFFPDGVFPGNTLLIVSGLVREDLLFEVHTIAGR
jgi:enamine deaminase RidA (YjgF/YER057c/UK114 family)